MKQLINLFFNVHLSKFGRLCFEGRYFKIFTVPCGKSRFLNLSEAAFYFFIKKIVKKFFYSKTIITFAPL